MKLLLTLFLQVNPTNNDNYNTQIKIICTLTKVDLISNSSYDQAISGYRKDRCEALNNDTRKKCENGMLSGEICRLECDDEFIECSDEDACNNACRYSLPQFCLGQVVNAYSLFTKEVDFIRERKDELLGTFGRISS